MRVTREVSAQDWIARGHSCLLAGHAAEGLAAFDRALELGPTLATAHSGRGLALAAAGRGAEALAAYRRAAELDPNDPTTFLEVAQLLLRLGHLGNAHAAFSAALELKPGDALALEGCAKTLMALGRHAEAIPVLSTLLAVAPDDDYLEGCKLNAQLHCCEWRDLAAASLAITKGVRRGRRVDNPFSFIAHNSSPADQRLCAEIYVADRCTVQRTVVQRPTRAPGARLRIGYVSADFRQHAVAQLLAGVFESHDRRRFETYAFCACPDDGSHLRRRLEAGFEHFLEVGALQDAAIAALMAKHAIDIAVDLGGHTTGSRTRALAHRPAPLQVAFLGFPGTLGAEFIDYIVADEHVIPESERIHYAEHVIYLPDSYLPCDFPKTTRTVQTREAAGLPPRGFVFCCFNAPYKYSPPMFDTWARILKAVPDGVLWLRQAAPVTHRNLCAAAAERGIDPNRLIFAATVADLADHQARLALADIFLDTHPYNAHTTASDALGAGVPVITLRGRPFCSRVATSLLHAVGLGELSADSAESYAQLAIELAANPAKLNALKAHLQRARTTAPLFDPLRFCRHLEHAYLEIQGRRERGEPPSSLRVMPQQARVS